MAPAEVAEVEEDIAGEKKGAAFVVRDVDGMQIEDEKQVQMEAVDSEVDMHCWNWEDTDSWVAKHLCVVEVAVVGAFAVDRQDAAGVEDMLVERDRNAGAETDVDVEVDLRLVR
ncbi:hypothetical protein BGX28_005835 [Mortierella sp. GBA30]|nr:hypothetical protein BGX28_005835 [Mortierella sp. GBA30]